MGPWLFVVNSFLEKHKDEYVPSYYGITTGSGKAEHNLKDIAEADIVLWLTDREYRFHNGMVRPSWAERSDNRLSEIRKVINGKRVIILCSEPADTIDLFRNVVFKGSSPDLRYLIESDFVPSLQTLKYYFIRDYLKPVNAFTDNATRQYDFGYWGSSKAKNNDGTQSTDVRHLILRELRKRLRAQSLFIGSVIPKSDRKYENDIRDLLKDLTNINATLCFVWPGREAFLTSRYQEAIACGIVPLLWKSFDCHNTASGDDWLRCYTAEDVLEKVNALRDPGFRNGMISKLVSEFEAKIPPKAFFADTFDKMMLNQLK